MNNKYSVKENNCSDHKKIIKEFNRRAVEKTGIIKVLSDRFSNQVNEEFDKTCSELVKKHFKKIKIKRMIDVGAGIGRMTKHFVKISQKVIGLDFADKMLLVAKRRFKNKNNIQLIHDDAVKTNFPTRHFDLGIVSLVLKHNSNERAATIIRKMKKWCKKILLVEHVTGGSRGSKIAVMRSESWYLKQFKPMKPTVIYRMKRYKDNMIFCILE